jgi:hypothetical protein
VSFRFELALSPLVLTSYDAATGGSVVNQVQRVYNGLGQLTGEYQAVSGAVDISTTPVVLYAYTEMTDGVNNSRPVSMTYPDGRVLSYNYASGLDDSISRLSSISDSSGTLESYAYLGLDTIVQRVQPQAGTELRNRCGIGVIHCAKKLGKGGSDVRSITETFRRNPAGNQVAVNSLPGGAGRQKGALRGSLLAGTRCQES